MESKNAEARDYSQVYTVKALYAHVSDIIYHIFNVGIMGNKYAICL